MAALTKGSSRMMRSMA